MKQKHLLKFTVLAFILLISFSRCAKDPSEPEEETPTTPTTTSPKFTWSINGNASVSGDDSFFVTAYNEIYGNKNGVTIIDIVLDTLRQGSYTIAPSKGISLDYFDGSNSYSAKSGNITITEFTGTRMSGSFNCSFASGGPSSLSGEFSNIPKK